MNTISVILFILFFLSSFLLFILTFAWSRDNVSGAKLLMAGHLIARETSKYIRDEYVNKYLALVYITIILFIGTAVSMIIWQ